MLLKRKDFDVNYHIWNQCFGYLKDQKPNVMEENIEAGFEPPCQLFTAESILASASKKGGKKDELGLKRNLITYIEASIDQQPVRNSAKQNFIHFKIGFFDSLYFRQANFE